MQNPPAGWPRIASAVFYEDAAAAIDWLCRAFGFEVQLKVENKRGQIAHSQLVLGGGLIMVGQAGLSPVARPVVSAVAPGGRRREHPVAVRLRGRRRRPLRAGARGLGRHHGRAGHPGLRRRPLGGQELPGPGPRGAPLVVRAPRARVACRRAVTLVGLLGREASPRHSGGPPHRPHRHAPSSSRHARAARATSGSAAAGTRANSST